MKDFTPIPLTPFPHIQRKGGQAALDHSYQQAFNIKSSTSMSEKVASLFTGRGFRGGVRLVLMFLLAALFTITSHAQPATPAAPISYDDVNAIAEKMYCPECENIPLDKCQTVVCTQWKSEIADQLTAGRSEQQIIDGFVARFGDQVLGIPQDSTLRNLSLYIPYLLTAAILLIGVFTFSRWRGQAPSAPVVTPDSDNDDYRARLENDLRG